MLNWSSRFRNCCFLDNNNYNHSCHDFECLAGVGASAVLQSPANKVFNRLQDFVSQHADYVFGHLSYDLKNEIEDLHSSNPDHIGFCDLFFFVPEYVIRLTTTSIEIGVKGNNHHYLFEQIISTGINQEAIISPVIDIRSRISKLDYLTAVEQIRRHILRGDCYELNFCQEFYAEQAEPDPLHVYNSLAKISPAPFSAFYRINDKYCICSSPERYLKKKGEILISQPIKGTSPRVHDDKALDETNKQALFQSEKERSENVMVVDLVRNDLSKVCVEGSVEVDELFGIYSFPQVHQMISTIKGKIKPGYTLIDAIRASFPMGSMTGAPKKKVMELIEQYESSKRGLFSGSIGYITPLGDADFNVVIRSILFNASENYLSYHVGSAITYNSDPGSEYEECLLKARAIKKVLAG